MVDLLKKQRIHKNFPPQCHQEHTKKKMEGSINLCLQSSKYLVLNIFDPQAVKIEEENVQAGREEGFAPENMNSI